MEKLLTKEIAYLDHLMSEYISKDYDFKRMFNMTQFHIMMYLIKHSDDDICQKDLEIEANLKKASITGVIDSLARKGFVERVQAEDDKRKNYIRMTKKSLDLKSMIEKNVTELNDFMTKGISKKELDNFFSVIERIKNNIEERK